MHGLAFEQHPPGDAVVTGDNGSLARGRPILGLRLVDRGERRIAIDLAVTYEDRSGLGAAKPGGRFGYCVQHRLHIGGRAADDVEHVAGRGLVFERFFEVARALLQFAEQSRVLHRDDRLVGKGAHQLDLPLGERLDPMAVKPDNADWLAVAQQRHAKHGASPGRHNLRKRVVRVRADVRDMHDPAFERRAPGDGVTTGDSCSLSDDCPILGVRCAERTGRRAVDLALACVDRSGIGAAEPGGCFDHRVQHGLHVGG
jgi:hypothetical protein